MFEFRQFVFVILYAVCMYFGLKQGGRLFASIWAGGIPIIYFDEYLSFESEYEHFITWAISGLITYFIARKISKANRERIRIRRLKRTRIERENAEREWQERESAERARRERESAERARRQRESAEREQYARKNAEILFRRAMQKVHPDRAPEHLQGMCQKLTAELNAARKADDYRKIREIAESVGVSLSDKK